MNALNRRGYSRPALLATVSLLLVVGSFYFLRDPQPVKAQTSTAQATSPQIEIEYAVPPTLHTPIAWEADEIEAMPTALLLQAGTSVSLAVAPNAAGILEGGSWKAEWGSVASNGTYTAPSHLPETGVDTVTYTDPNGNLEEVSIRVVPNPGISGSETTPTVRVNIPMQSAGDGWTNGVPDDMQQQAAPNTAAGASIDDVTEQFGNSVVMLGPGESLPPLEEYLPPQTLSIETNGGEAFARLISQEYPAGAFPLCIRLQLGQTPPQSVRLAPTAPEDVVQNRQAMAAEPCVAELALSGAQQSPSSTGCARCSPAGKIEWQYLPPSDWRLIHGPDFVHYGNFTITGSRKTTILASIPELASVTGEGSVQVGITLDVTIKDWSYKKTQKRHMYKCISGKMKYVRTEERVATGSKRSFLPYYWLWPVLGGPPPGEIRSDGWSVNWP